MQEKPHAENLLEQKTARKKRPRVLLNRSPTAFLFPAQVFLASTEKGHSMAMGNLPINADALSLHYPQTRSSSQCRISQSVNPL